MFATAIIVLPSLYTGGEVHVSHGASRKVFDLASTTHFNASILAWYTDVMHEVKPVTSGYRLALSYNLIHTSPGIPRPTLPDVHSAIARLRHVLYKWSKDAYADSMLDWETDMVAYVLEHKYSKVNLKIGALKGADRHMISNLRVVAEELGFKVCLANLQYTETGYGEDCGGYSHKKRRYSYYDDSDDEESSEEEEDPGMAEVEDTSLTIDNLVDLDGMEILHGKTLSLGTDSVIPEDYFEDESPDDHEYEGYTGNVSFK